MSSLARLAMSLALACAFLATPARGQVEKIFDSAGVPIRYVEQGSGEPVILLHGYLKDFERLKTAMPQLALVQIDGASHGNAPNRPEFVTALKAFLAAHPKKSQGGN